MFSVRVAAWVGVVIDQSPAEISEMCAWYNLFENEGQFYLLAGAVAKISGDNWRFPQNSASALLLPWSGRVDSENSIRSFYY